MYFKIKQSCHYFENGLENSVLLKFVFSVFVPLLANFILFQFGNLYSVDIFSIFFEKSTMKSFLKNAF